MKTNFLKTRTNISKIALLLCFSLTTTFCSKDDTPTPPAVLAPLQDPLPGYLSASGFYQQTEIIINSDNFETGYSFVPLVNGKITAIAVKLPAVNNNVRVTIWDKATATAIRTERIDIPRVNTEIIKQITALDLIKDKEYIISINSNDYYAYVRSDFSNGNYPFTVGDIKITSFWYFEGSSQTMPNTADFMAYLGDCSFKFQK